MVQAQQPAQETNLIDIEGGSGAAGQAQRTQLMLEEEQNLQQLQDRERAVRQLESDIGDVNQIFKDLAAMVHDQVGIQMDVYVVGGGWVTEGKAYTTLWD